MIAFALALSVAAQGFTRARTYHEELEPTTGLLTEGPCDPYHLALARALLTGWGERRCQVLAIPSFEAEWCIHLDFDPDPREGLDPSRVRASPRLVLRRMSKHLWSEMMDELHKTAVDGATRLDDESMTAALTRLSVPVHERIALISTETAEALDAVWSGMLQRTRHPDEATCGNDGTTYHVAHWQIGIGYRAAETWSPDEGTRAAALIGLAERMARLAEAPGPECRELEDELLASARSLLEGIRRAEEQERRR
jgi:hypothetical protein